MEEIKGTSHELRIDGLGKYALPIFSIGEKGLETKEELKIQLVKGRTSGLGLTLLDLVDKADGGSLWKLEEGETINYYELGDANLQMIKAVCQDEESGIFVLEAMDSDTNRTFKIPFDKLVDEAGKRITEPKLGDAGFIAAMEVTREEKEQEGVLLEMLLNLVLVDLQTTHKAQPTKEVSMAITKVEETLLWLMKYSFDMANRRKGVAKGNVE